MPPRPAATCATAELSADRRRALEGAAGGTNPRRVWKYCKYVLAVTEGTAHGGKSQSRDGKGDGGGRDGYGSQDGQGDQGGDGDGHHIGPGVIGGTATQSSRPPLQPSRLLPTRAPSPSPTYSAL